MKQIKKMTAMLLCGGLMLSALPLTAASAAEIVDPETGAPIEMTAKITLSETTAKADGKNVTVDGTKITITASGAYEFSGTLTDGQIYVNVADEVADPGTVKLYFNGINITGVSDAPLYIANAENTSINLVDGTENFLADGALYKDANAVIYAKDDMTIKNCGAEGTGKLVVTSTYQNGIHCNNDIKINGGNVKVRTNDGDGSTTGIGDGIRGKTSVEIKDGKLDVNAGGDGVKSTKGDVLITGGKTEIKAAKDAVQGETSVQISGGSLIANGDRSLTNANAEAGNAVTITGGKILATATDAQATVVGNTQPVILFNTSAQVAKDNVVELYTDGAEKAVFSKNPDKKFDYALISSPDLTVGTAYELKIGGYAVENGKFTLAEGITTLEKVTANIPEKQPEERNMDINEDTHVDVSDAVLMARLLAEDPKAIVTEVGRSRLDTDGDGSFSTADVLKVLRKIARLE